MTTDTAPRLGKQQAQVLRMLKERDRCGVEFLRAYLPRFGGRIHELRQMGYVIERYPCRLTAHRHETTQWAYRLAE